MLENITLENLTFSKLFKEYDKYIKLSLKPDSYRKVNNIYINHIMPYFKDLKVKDANFSIYINWLEEIDKKGYSASYNSDIRGHMITLLNHAMTFYGLENNILSNIKVFNKRKTNKQEINFWTYEEFKSFISKVDEELYYTLFTTLFFTGTRIGECLALTWNDLKNDYITINKTIAKEKDKNRNNIITTPKTPSSNRNIQLDNYTLLLLNKLKEQQKTIPGFNNNWFIFGGSKTLSRTTIDSRKTKYTQLANIKKIRLHDFRHSHATFLLSYGVPITVISKRLGHKDVTTTFNTYIHFIPCDEDKAINLINNLTCPNLYKY